MNRDMKVSRILVIPCLSRDLKCNNAERTKLVSHYRAGMFAGVGQARLPLPKTLDEYKKRWQFKKEKNKTKQKNNFTKKTIATYVPKPSVEL